MKPYDGEGLMVMMNQMTMRYEYIVVVLILMDDEDRILQRNHSMICVL